ncbi:haloalkane dehalogenase [Paraburkholderia sp. GV068]|uniref:alpha/beta fold hydrolase n=3 Tax=Paraburkholderia TaxID=1822464 RepID=UPI000D31E8A2|nr:MULTISPECIES: alpha/beta fold hydrolase [unclassified Paraburkholderia]PTQ99155.1 haloalkane dehalogenase [Paraburkholderia sp. GV072]PUB04646.1 haloalkane dehalogenase [Paraburkholderia sp. GV068]
MTPSNDTFDGTFPFSPRFSDVAGFRMHYVDEGPADGEVVMCIHGEPTWGYLFRDLIAALAGNYRVIAPDHMGFGKSETPEHRTYWLQDHIDNIEKFVLALDLNDITLVMHDFGGPVGMGLAARHPGRIRRIVSTNGPTPFGQSTLFKRLNANAAVSPWFQWVLRADSQGRLESVLDELGFNILSTLNLNGFENHARINDTWLRAYGSRFAVPADSAGAVGWAKGFAIGAHRFEVPDSTALDSIRSKPALAIWGEADRTLAAEHFLPLFSEIFPMAPIHRLAGVGHYSFEDAPGEIAELIAGFLKAR